MAINWHCPHCHHKVTITNDRQSVDYHPLKIESRDGRIAIKTEFRVCPNDECRKTTLIASLRTWGITEGREMYSAAREEWQLIPDSSAKPYPDYVPAAIREDYTEACAVRDLSPKASATLARRALQGILRDFYAVKAGRLVDEIKQVKDKMDAELWDALEGVRKVGNIGAHMEKDISVIVEVDPEEAQMLIELIELMIEETYVRRADRTSRISKVSGLAAAKQAELAATKAATPIAPPKP